MKIGINFSTGAKNLSSSLKEVAQESDEKKDELVLELARHTKLTILRRMRRQAARGKTYRRYNPLRIVTASAPGQMPAIDTKRLIRSIQINKEGNGYTVGTANPVGFWMEFGTRFMAARPWLRPGARLAWKNAPEFVKKIMRIRV